MTTADTREAVEVALRYARPDDVIEGVKSAVVAGLEGLDSTADIRTTEYFNHSFVPDIVLTWREGGRESVRNIFLRFSLGSAAAGRDIEALGGFGPVLLGLREEPDAAILDEMRAEAAAAPEVLVTDIRSLEDIRHRSGRGVTADATGSARQPLLQLVRGNVMRGGRGLFLADSVEVSALTGTGADETDEIASLDAFNAVVRDLFVTDAAARLIRAGQMLRLGISGDITDLGSALDEPSAVIRGSLSEAELLVVLPYLLSRDDVTDDPRYWAYVGEMVSLKRLEDMSDRLVGLDLTRLVTPNLAAWSAARAGVGFNVDSAEDGPAINTDGWRIHGRMLALVAGAWIIHLTNDRRKLSGRKDSPAAQWTDLADPLSRFSLTAVTLQGLMRRIRLEAERSDNVYRDVETITSNLDDTFRVPVVEVLDTNDPVGAVVTADFTRMITEARGTASASMLVRVARELLAQARPS